MANAKPVQTPAKGQTKFKSTIESRKSAVPGKDGKVKEVTMKIKTN